MNECLFVSDLHGKPERYRKLLRNIEVETPKAVFIGGDFLPLRYSGPSGFSPQDFIPKFLLGRLLQLKGELGDRYPRIFLIMGNDDPRSEESLLLQAQSLGILEYVQNRKVDFNGWAVYGYGYVPPTPFRLKDWERYDVSRYVDPGCISPEEGARSFPVSDQDKRYALIQADLAQLAGKENLDRSIFLFHAPPYMTALDLAGLEGKKVDHVPLDPHVGSIAIRRFIETRQPLLTLHGHIHESARLSNSWRDQIGLTHCFSAAHDGPELALVRFDPDHLDEATRELI
jgi:Icc-related predicted phosphoesterase